MIIRRNRAEEGGEAEKENTPNNSRREKNARDE